MRERRMLAAAVVAAAAMGAPAFAQCSPDWDRTIGTAGVIPTPGTNSNFGSGAYVDCFATFDDGTGEALYIGGTFDNLGGVCGTSGVAKWDGMNYLPLGDGVGNPFSNFEVVDMAVFDDGTGPALFVAGTFSEAFGVPDTARIAKWDGTQWHSVATGLEFFTNQVRALQVWDDGTGPALYIAGSFTSISGVAANNIVKYDGTTFTPLLGGVTGGNNRVHDLTVFNNKLVVAGWFSRFDNGAGTESALDLAEWNGTSWEQVAEFGIDGGSVGTTFVNAVQVFDDGTGAKLYIGGRNLLSPNPSDPLDFTAALVWDGGDLAESVTSVGVALPQTVYSFAVFDDGAGAALYAGRQLPTTATTTDRIMKLTPGGWAEVGGGANDSVFALFTWDSGTGADLYVGGGFDMAGGQPAGGLAVWTGGAVTDPAGWDQTIGSVAAAPTFGIADGSVNTFVVRNLFDQDYVYIGGSFNNIGGICGSSGVVYWNAQSGFGAMGQGVWNPNGNFDVLDMQVFDDGTGEGVFVAGTFQTASNVPFTSGIAKWNGGSWEAVAEFGFFLDSARSLAVWDDGTGPALYIGGNFTQIRKPGDPSFVTAKGIVKYDGTTFTALGATPGITTGGFVQDMEAFQGKLYVGGRFFDAGGISVEGFAAWDGTAWSRPDQFRLDNAFIINDMAVFDDGAGERLYIGGRNLDILEDPTDPLNPNVVRTSVAVYDGGTELDSLSYDGVLLQDLEARKLAVFNDGTGDALYVGGEAASGVAVWTGCPAPACLCELDGDDAQVNVFDLLAYLDLWFPQDAAADIDGAAGVDVFDLLAYLDCWFPASAGAPCP